MESPAIFSIASFRNMTDQLKKSIALAAKISAKAEDALAKIDHEMTIMDWPDEFRAVMWEAIADTAAIRARQSRGES